MPLHKSQIDTGIVAQFLSRSFASGETIAILLRRASPAATVQRAKFREVGLIGNLEVIVNVPQL